MKDVTEDGDRVSHVGTVGCGETETLGVIVCGSGWTHWVQE